MTWGFVGAAAITAVAGNVAANKASNAAESTAKSTTEAAALQAEYADRASALLDPFQQIGQQGLDESGFLTDPNAQFDFLQNNPLFKQAQAQNLQQTNDARDNLMKMSAARGRLSSGDTLQQLNTLDENSARNLLLSSQGLIGDQKNSIGDLLNFGQSAAANQGNLLTGQGATLAGGIMGSRNALNAGVQADINNITGLGDVASGFVQKQWGQ